MARPKNPTPTYRRFRDAARCWVNGRWVQLGKYDSPESYVEHARILAELAAAPAARFVSRSSQSVNQVLAAFWLHAEQHYRYPDGRPTNELPQYRQTFAIVRRLYGHTPAGEFGPLALKAVRHAMIEAGWCRLIVNQRIGRVRRAFKWAASEEIVPVAVYQGLAAVAGLQSGRTKARDMEPIKPVSQERVDATLPHLQPAVCAMVQIQLLTGMRPGEVCQLRRCDIDESGPIWLFRPVQYKTRYRGKSRVVTIGPKAQSVIKPFFTDDPSAFLFSPRRTVAAFHAMRALQRKTPLYPSHIRRNASKRVQAQERQLSPADRYTPTSYSHAILRACEKAFPLPEDLAQGPDEIVAAWWERLTAEQQQAVLRWRRANSWHANQLRHAHATTVRRRFGLEAAQVALGHERADVTQVYAEKNLELAARVAAEVG